MWLLLVYRFMLYNWKVMRFDQNQEKAYTRDRHKNEIPGGCLTNLIAWSIFSLFRSLQFLQVIPVVSSIGSIVQQVHWAGEPTLPFSLQSSGSVWVSTHYHYHSYIYVARIQTKIWKANQLSGKVAAVRPHLCSVIRANWLLYHVQGFVQRRTQQDKYSNNTKT